MRIIVAGGGASGLMAALTAKQSGAEDVLILERGGEIGKKILSTGSGRCNLTNENQSPECYHSSLPGSFNPVLSQFSKDDTIRFFEENGLHLKAKNGYYYPRNAQALSVRDFLRDCCRKAGVRVELNKKITGVWHDPESPAGTVPVGKASGKHQDRKIPQTDENRGKRYCEHTETERQFGSGKGETGDDSFRITCEDGSVCSCDCLILAGGGKAAPQTGSDGGMYSIARKLGHAVVAPVPALVPLCVKKEDLKFFKIAGGARADGRITLVFHREEKNEICSNEKGKNQVLRDEFLNMADETTPESVVPVTTETVTDCGEIQFTDYGLSGIPAFNVSAAAARTLSVGQFENNCAGTGSAGKAAGAKLSEKRTGTGAQTKSPGGRVWVEVDLLPEIAPELLKHQFDSYRERFPEDTFRMWLRSYLPAKLVEAVLALVGIPPALYLRKCTDGEAEKLLNALKGSRFALEGTSGFEKAQTTSGGIDMREVDLRTLESKYVPGLYFAGEILDVDGICGGYNLQWAWSSGFAAGKAAAQKIL